MTNSLFASALVDRGWFIVRVLQLGRWPATPIVNRRGSTGTVAPLG